MVSTEVSEEILNKKIWTIETRGRKFFFLFFPVKNGKKTFSSWTDETSR